jgi:hypothetical protein
MKIVLINVIYGIGTILLISYDERPRGGLVTIQKKTPCPPCLKRGFEAGVHRIENDFHNSGENIWVIPDSPESKKLLFTSRTYPSIRGAKKRAPFSSCTMEKNMHETVASTE